MHWGESGSSIFWDLSDLKKLKSEVVIVDKCMFKGGLFGFTELLFDVVLEKIRSVICKTQNGLFLYLLDRSSVFWELNQLLFNLEMETLVVVSQHKNHYYDRTRGQAPIRFGSFGSPPSVGFKEINCRNFESGVGILPTPLKVCSTPVTKKGYSSSFCSKTPSPPSSIQGKSHSELQKRSKKSAHSSAVSIPIDIKLGGDSRKEGSLNDEFAYSELWAGPAYSNSPPPSSLPIPKFSVKPKRTVSLELPTTSPFGIDLLPFAKSAPASPTRERSPSPGVLSDCTDSATQTLRRILNLEIMD